MKINYQQWQETAESVVRNAWGNPGRMPDMTIEVKPPDVLAVTIELYGKRTEQHFDIRAIEAANLDLVDAEIEIITGNLVASVKEWLGDTSPA